MSVLRELLTMWREMRMIILVAVVAAVYSATLILFEGLITMPGIRSVNPANVFPVISGIMFGPAAAWGSALGTLVRDMAAGPLTLESVGRFAGNFAFGFVGYKLWGNLGPLSCNREPDFRRKVGRQLIEFWIITLVAATITAAIISWWFEILSLFPFSVSATIITVSSFIAAAFLGPILMYIFYPRIKEMGLLYPDVMAAIDYKQAKGSRAVIAAYGITAISILWVVIGITFSLGLQDVTFSVIPPTEMAPGQQGGSTVQIVLGLIGFVFFIAFSWMGGERMSKLI